MIKTKLFALAILSGGLLLSACGPEGELPLPAGITSEEDSSVVSQESQESQGSQESAESAASVESAESKDSTPAATLSVVGKTFVGDNIEQKDFAYYEQALEVIKVTTVTFNEDGTYWTYSAKSHSGAMVRDMETFMFGTYVVGEEQIEATPDYGIFDGVRSDIPDNMKEANKSIYYWGEDNKLRLKSMDMDQSGMVELDVVMIEGEPIKEYEASETFAVYNFQNAFAEATGSDELPEAAQTNVTNANATYAQATLNLGDKGTAYVEIPSQGHVAKFQGTYEAGENDGEYVLQWKGYYLDGEFVFEMNNPPFTIVPMNNGYKVPLDASHSEYTVYAYYAVNN